MPPAITQKPKSSCNQGCPKVLKRVCGSDNVTYDNKCLLKKTACEKNKKITIVKKGRCEGKSLAVKRFHFDNLVIYGYNCLMLNCAISFLHATSYHPETEVFLQSGMS